MKKLIALLAVITALSFNSSTEAAAPMPQMELSKPTLENVPFELTIKTATFTVQHHDIAIRVASPKKVSEIGVVPDDGKVGFEVVPFAEIVNGNNPRQYLAGSDMSFGNRYHDSGRLSNGERYGRLGAMTYLLDDSGNEKSNGYHELTPFENGYYGKTGVMTYILDSKGVQLSKGYHSITPTESGYTAKIGGTTYNLDKMGKEIPESSK